MWEKLEVGRIVNNPIIEVNQLISIFKRAFW